MEARVIQHWMKEEEFPELFFGRKLVMHQIVTVLFIKQNK